MTEAVICLDTSVLIKFLVPEEPRHLDEAATQVVRRAFGSGRVVAPAFGWVEVGTVLRKKVRQGVVTGRRAEQQWLVYHRLPIEFIDNPLLRDRAWEIAEQHGLRTMYDAAFLACTEVALASVTATREFWTTDLALMRSLGTNRPPYVRVLGEDDS